MAGDWSGGDVERSEEGRWGMAQRSVKRRRRNVSSRRDLSTKRGSSIAATATLTSAVGWPFLS